ncbi:eCIS core domain-containing protein [Nitrococcus mobilis]|uniref:eCIS core domain-containing protein n=1 Tax=Nitrococcus mobilis Nb-231 TaxID=314278 RepID=A4BQC1_9GAMM|nr:DUF4157 domain-containing protein [Nitrococcus mobilis]EAR22276.1 hypothetical protein NB231_05185 [Nitrococcus mobilis Nb-231]
MRTFAQKPGATQQTKPAESAKASRMPSGKHREAHSNLHPQRAIGNQAAQRSLRGDLESLEIESSNQSAARFRHDFSRIPIYQKGNQQSGGGEPLATITRARLESILGTRVGDVRIHRGPAAERAATAVGAPAFTVGQDIVLGAASGKTAQTTAQGSPQHLTTPHGEQILAHEAAHTVQQSGAAQAPRPLPERLPRSPVVDSLFGWQRQALPRTAPGGAEEREADAAARGLERPTPGARLAIAAAPPTALPFKPTKSFKEIWPEFERARYGSDIAKATALARELATAPHDFDDILNHGIDVVDWLQRQGEPALAASLLGEVRSVWMIQFVSEGAALPSRTSLSWASSDPGVLIALGKEAARAGEHEQAVSLLGVANEILSYYALEAPQKRAKVLKTESAAQTQLDPELRSALTLPRMLARSAQYSDLESIYDQMRDIYGVYSVLEREALAAGDTKGAAEARANSAKLHKAIKKKHTWGHTQTAGSISTEILDPVEIAEVSDTDTPKGPGLTLHGANHAETTLTQLPGLPSPKEIGNNVQVQNLGALQSALMAQTDFQAEIGRQPEIRKAFGNKPIDLNKTADRQKVWRIMYGVFKQSGTGALGSLMALIGRYLRAFTIHTRYNVRDWGKSYLDSDMPTDLAGRAERDCGVYALSVAWDVYQTVKRGDSKLHVTFDLTTMLGHVTLVITDKSTGEYYVVNNDQVSPPQRGDPLTQVAPQYGAVRGLPYTVGPAVTVALGSTKDPQKRFRGQAWRRYLAAVDWGLKLDIPPEVAKLKKTDPAAYSENVQAIQQARYKGFYRDQETFDRGAKELDPLVDALAPVAGDQAKLAPALDPLVDKAGALAALFIQLAQPGVVTTLAKSQAILPRKPQFLFTLEQGHTVHPIARVALGILHFKAIGGKLTPKQDALVKFCKTVPMFKQQMDAYQAAGARGKFKTVP